MVGSTLLCLQVSPRPRFEDKALTGRQCRVPKSCHRSPEQKVLRRRWETASSVRGNKKEWRVRLAGTRTTDACGECDRLPHDAVADMRPLTRVIRLIDVTVGHSTTANKRERRRDIKEIRKKNRKQTQSDRCAVSGGNRDKVADNSTLQYILRACGVGAIGSLFSAAAAERRLPSAAATRRPEHDSIW